MNNRTVESTVPFVKLIVPFPQVGLEFDGTMK